MLVGLYVAGVVAVDAERRLDRGTVDGRFYEKPAWLSATGMVVAVAAWTCRRLGHGRASD